MIDFVYYWYHRFSHRVRFMWAVHMNHHSSEEMNFTVSLRQAWFGPITKVPFFIFMPLVGFDPIITAVAGVASTLWGVIGHTQWIRRLGILEYIFVTPSSHRVHHGSNECYIDRNYGNLLIIWDRLFGTFQEELDEEPPVYGVLKPVKTWNPLLINFQHLWGLIFDAWHTKSWREKLTLWWRPTGYRPDDVKKRFNANQQVQSIIKGSISSIFDWSKIELITLLLLFFILDLSSLIDVGVGKSFVGGMISVLLYPTPN